MEHIIIGDIGIIACDKLNNCMDEAEAHANQKDNPHTTTALQVGAPTVKDLTDHTGNKANPHGTTAAQVGAPTVKDLNDGLAKKENSLGNPAKDGQVLSSKITGERSWIDSSSGGSIKVSKAGGATVDPCKEIQIGDRMTLVDKGSGVAEVNSVGGGGAEDQPARDQIKAIQGTANWNDAPDTTLKGAKANLDALNSAIGKKVETSGAATAGHIPIYQDATGLHVTDSGKQVSDFESAGAAAAAIAAHNTAFAHANIPATDQKAALVGTDGTPSDANRYVTNSDPRLKGSGSVDAAARAALAGAKGTTNYDDPNPITLAAAKTALDGKANLTHSHPTATTSAAGFLPTLSGNADQCFQGNGVWGAKGGGSGPLEYEIAGPDGLKAFIRANEAGVTITGTATAGTIALTLPAATTRLYRVAVQFGLAYVPASKNVSIDVDAGGIVYKDVLRGIPGILKSDNSASLISMPSLSGTPLDGHTWRFKNIAQDDVVYTVVFLF